MGFARWDSTFLQLRRAQHCPKPTREEKRKDGKAGKQHLGWDLLIVPPPGGDKDQGVGVNPDLEEHVAAGAEDGHQAGVLLQGVPELQQHAQLVCKPGTERGHVALSSCCCVTID